MTTYCLEMRSTADWSDCRYRDYTTNSRKAEAFRSVPKIKFTDSGHGIVPSVNIHHGRKLPAIRVLSDYVAEHIAATVEKPKPVIFTVKLTSDERTAAMEALSRHIARADLGEVPRDDIEFFKSALSKI